MGEKAEINRKAETKSKSARKRKRVNRESEKELTGKRENQSAITRCHSHWLITAASKKQPGVCVCVWCVHWLASNLWLLQREVSITYPITDENNRAHFWVSFSPLPKHIQEPAHAHMARLWKTDRLWQTCRQTHKQTDGLGQADRRTAAFFDQLLS